ncbi:branched-chain amino acid transport system ATP-binding protein [Bradyrhizobium sp. USDA 4449]
MLQRPETMMQLEATGISVRFGGISALSDVRLSLSRGEVVGLIGPNGAGKTTLVNCLTGFQKPNEGVILVDGAQTAGWTAADFRARGVSRTFQSGRLFSDMTVSENVEVPLVALGLARGKARREAMDILARLGIVTLADKFAGVLPYTDERRVGIARALAMRPKFVLLDEPAAGMSDSECEELMHIIRKLPCTFDCGVLLIEHNMTLVMSVSDRLHVLDGGRTLVEGTPDEVRCNGAVIEAYLGTEA